MNIEFIRRLRQVAAIALMLFLYASFGLYAQTQPDEDTTPKDSSIANTELGSFGVDVGIYYSDLLNVNVGGESGAEFDIIRFLFNLRPGFDLGLQISLTDWLNITLNTGVYAIYYSLDAAVPDNTGENGVIVEIPVRVGTRFNLDFGTIRPFFGYVPTYIGGIEETLHYLEAGAAIQFLDIFKITGSYAWEVSETGAQYAFLHNPEGIFRIGFSVELFQLTF